MKKMEFPKIEGFEAVEYFSGSNGRIMVGNSLTSFEKGNWTNDVVLGASFAGVPTGVLPLRQGAKGWIAHEAGPGKDEAGIGGLVIADEYGVPAAAIATMEASLGDGRTLLTGSVSRCNNAAKALGVAPGQTGEEAAHLMLKGKPGKQIDISGRVDEETHSVDTPYGKVYLCWSTSRVKGMHPDDIFCVASHGGETMALYALGIMPKGVICNDAGKGMDDSGVDGLWTLDKHGIMAATVSTDTARIGYPMDTYEVGIISTINKTAEAKGIRVGQTAREAAQLMLKS
ncbi:uncharacterized protein YunC (DUF1805 family) [Neobacillus niacini]|uniref:hypothetical protein n=1 Tax=Neobacillus niacini TaxID=86668 RepID=UPI0028615F82|nr:hypothetical protein [Neobacillus niacini]MDR7076153.1 uncharacterized protein YunC (DUF1805 family) [Neobacillus niacini]